MAHQYKPILWNQQKKRYDLILLVFIFGFLALFVGLNLIFQSEITVETLIIRSFGILALILLHIILIIGPLSRINSRFLVLLYNRRHLGVTMFFIALIHGVFSIVHFHGFGNENPLISIFTSNTEYGSLINFPFQTLGFLALIIFMVMAATSHDFWLKNLGPGMWKTLHMFVYLAYSLVVMHVMLGAVQDEKSVVLPGLIFVGTLIISGLHIFAGRMEVKERAGTDEWVKATGVDQIPENGAITVFLHNEKVAIFKYNGTLSAVSNYCRHQGGPIGEGKIIDGCITCPWHGYQYYPHNGCSPPPFDEKLEMYRLKIEHDLVYVNQSSSQNTGSPIRIKDKKISL